MSDPRLAQALADGREALAHLPDPMREARTLLAHAAGIGRERLHDPGSDDLGDDVLRRYRDLLAQRAGGRPLARLLGYRDFWKHRFHLSDAVLDPRADTETLVACALELDWSRCLDLGTGSGAILLSLLAERPGATGTGTDISSAALDVARRNADEIGVADRVELQLSDWYGAVSGRFDLIVSNPPYIAAREMDTLSPEVSLHDPRLALTDEGDGLGAYRAIIAGARDHLFAGGSLLVEIGWRQRAGVEALLQGRGFEGIACHRDMEGRDRAISAILG